MEIHESNMQQIPVKRKKISEEPDDIEEEFKETSPKKSKSESTVESELVKENTNVSNNIESTNPNKEKSNSDPGSNAEFDKNFNLFSGAINETETHENRKSIIENAGELSVQLDLSKVGKHQSIQDTVVETETSVKVESSSTSLPELEKTESDREDDIWEINEPRENNEAVCTSIYTTQINDSCESNAVEVSYERIKGEVAENIIDDKDDENDKSVDVDSKDTEVFADARSNVKNSENAEDYKNNASDNIVENKENLQDADDVESVVEICFYRLLRPDESYDTGIIPKNINSVTTINDHVANGSNPSQSSRFVSCSKSKEKIMQFAGLIRRRERWIQRTVVKIDKAKLGNNVTIIDLTEESNRELHLHEERAKRNAIRFDEVLLAPDTVIPAESITAIAHIRNRKITHYS